MQITGFIPTQINGDLGVGVRRPAPQATFDPGKKFTKIYLKLGFKASVKIDFVK